MTGSPRFVGGRPVRARKTSSRSGVCTVSPATSIARVVEPCRAPTCSCRRLPSLGTSRAASPVGRGRAGQCGGRGLQRRGGRGTAAGREPPGTSRLSSSAVPSATSRPPSSTPIRSASWSASSRYCVVSRMVTPSATSSRTISHMVRRLRGSRPVVGSSRKTIRGSPISPMARSSRAAHAPGVGGAGVVPAASASSNRSSRSAARRRPSCRAEVPQVGHQPQVLLAGEQVVDGGELPGDGDGGADRLGFARHVVPGRRGPSPPSARVQRGEDVDGRRLAGAVRAEQGEDRPFRHGQVEAVEDDVVAEGLAEPGGRDGRGDGSGHGSLSVGGGGRVAQARRTTMSP